MGWAIYPSAETIRGTQAGPVKKKREGEKENGEGSDLRLSLYGIRQGKAVKYPSAPFYPPPLGFWRFLYAALQNAGGP